MVRRSRKPKLPKQQLVQLSSRLEELISKKKNLQEQKAELETKIYKLETNFLETGQGFPITTSLDYYLGTRGEKKKYNVNAKDRIFSTLLPKVYRS